MKNLNKIHFYFVIVANESMSLDVILGRDFMDACNPNLNLDTLKMVTVENIENPYNVSDEKQIVSDEKQIVSDGASDEKQIVIDDVSNVSDEKQIVSDNVKDKNTIFSDVNHGISYSRETIKEIFSKIRDDEKVTDKNYIEPDINLVEKKLFNINFTDESVEYKVGDHVNYNDRCQFVTIVESCYVKKKRPKEPEVRCEMKLRLEDSKRFSCSPSRLAYTEK